MSLFGTYIEESSNTSVEETVVAPDRSTNITESSNELAFIAGNIIAEAQNYETFVCMEDSIYEAVYTEAVKDKLETINKKFKEFIAKAIQFFQDLSDRIQIAVLTKLAKVTAGETFKSSVEYLDLIKMEADSTWQKANETLKKMIKLFEEGKDPDKAIYDDLVKDLKDLNWAKFYSRKEFKVTKKAGAPVDSVVKNYINYGKQFFDRNRKLMASLKKIGAKYENEKNPEAKAGVVKVVSAAMTFYRIENAQLISNAAKILTALNKKEKTEGKEEKK